ncbi:hypothetical protein ACFFX0_08670 [Citricoccus parietis]|uniref:Uncharacterized protein n=1 Tax=Citricoccus parietis TaxID=592307 RepID=A0ABV5FYF4_9MICC
MPSSGPAPRVGVHSSMVMGGPSGRSAARRPGQVGGISAWWYGACRPGSRWSTAGGLRGRRRWSAPVRQARPHYRS